MFNVYRKEMSWGGRRLVLETGKVARQADASVVVTYGETTVLCTVVGEKTPKLDLGVAGTAEGVLVVESEAHELSEDVMLGAVTFGQRGFAPVIDMIIQLAELCAKDPWPLPERAPQYETLKKRILELVGADID